MDTFKKVGLTAKVLIIISYTLFFISNIDAYGVAGIILFGLGVVLLLLSILDKTINEIQNEKRSKKWD